MDRKDFALLLSKYNQGNCTDEEKVFVENWYAIMQNEDRQALTESDLDLIEPVMWKKIQNQIQAGESESALMNYPAKKRTTFRWLAIAASVIVLIGIFFRLQNNEISFNERDFNFGKELTEKRNNSTEQLAIKLPDGSAVTLSPGASVAYRISADLAEREVYLTGDAFFDISRMPSKPFYVYTKDVVTKVLGTRFFVRAEKLSGQVSIEVVSGRVAVYQKSEKDGNTAKVILTPNQKTIFKEEKKEFVTSLVDLPKLVSTNEDNQKPVSFQFEEEPLSSVVQRLKGAYGVNIQIENQKLNECPLTADLSDFSLYEQLDMICAATKSHYIRKGTVILIDGKGCANLQ